MNRRIILAGMISSLATTMASSHASVPPKRCRIEFPAHELEFSLPDEFVRESLPTPIEKYFDPHEPGAFENGFRTLAAAMHDFNGRFWEGTLGSLKFTVLAQERSRKFSGEISDIDGLENYIVWW